MRATLWCRHRDFRGWRTGIPRWGAPVTQPFRLLTSRGGRRCLRAPRTAIMDITFCSVCNESIPVADLHGGRAVHRGKGVVCAACERAMGIEAGQSASSAAPPSAAATTSDGAVFAAAPAATPSAPRAAGGRWTSAIALSALAAAASAWFVLDRRLQAAQAETRDTQLKLARLEPLRDELARQADEARARARDDREAARVAEESGARRVSELQGQLADARAALQSLARRADEADQLRARVQALEPLTPRVQDLESKLRAFGEERERLLARIEELGRGVAAAKEAASGAPVGPAAPPRPAWEGRLADLKNPNEAARLEAVLFLAESHDPLVVPHLVPMLRDANLFVRTATARALRDMKTKEGEALLALCDALLDDKAPVREAAWVALRACTGLELAFDPLGSDADRARRARAWREAVEGGLQPRRDAEPGPPPAVPPTPGG